MTKQRLFLLGAWWLVVSCAGPRSEEPAVQEPAVVSGEGSERPGGVTADGGAAAAEPRPEVPAIDAGLAAGACAQEGPAKLECDCAAGDDEACLEYGDHLFRRRKHALAVSVVERLCTSGNAEGCLRAARFIERRKAPRGAGASVAELRERAMALFEKDCGEDRAEGCFQLGEMLHRGRLVARDVPRGIAQADRACVLGHARACASLSGIYEQGAGVDKDEQRALDYLDRACEAGHAAACSHLGDKVARRDGKRALALYEKACAAEDAIGCARFGTAHERGRGVGRDYARAVELHEKACDLEHRPSCTSAADLLVAGKGVVRDLERARARYALACDDDQGKACAALAALVAKGSGGPRNWGEAVTLYDKACQLKVRKACKQGARLRRRPPDWRCADPATCREKCAERVGKSCTRLGQILARSQEADRCSLAEEAFTLGCEHGDGAACVPLGRIERSPDSALVLFQKGCAAGDDAACALYQVSRYKLGDEAERRGAVRILNKACNKRKRVESCVALGNLYARAERKPKLARKLWRAACARKHGRACSILARDYSSGYGWTSSDARRNDAAESAEHRRLLKKACNLGVALACVELADTYRSQDEAQFRKWLERADALEPVSPCPGME